MFCNVRVLAIAIADGERESMAVYRFSVAMNSLISSLSIFVTGNIISKVIITALMNDFSRQIR